VSTLIIYNKLVRDKIPEIIRNDNKECVTNILDDETYAKELKRDSMEKGYRKRIDFSNKSNQKLWKYDEKGVANLIARMPMTKWLDDDHLIRFENNRFQINFPIAEEDREILHQMTEQICEFKLKTYFNRRDQKEL